MVSCKLNRTLRVGVTFTLGLFLLISGTSFTAAQDEPSGYGDFVTAVERVAKDVGPAVVSIVSERIETVETSYRYRQNPYYDEFFEKFFEDFFGAPQQRAFKQHGFGSGVIIDQRGYILTNEHVIEGATTLKVILADGREFPAQIKGTDPQSDLAVIKIDAPKDLPVAKLGESANLKTGEWVVAIGNPFGHILNNPEPTVTTGVISALNRSLQGGSRRDTDYSDLIQTDAAINPGNSGGPLVNLKGEVIGINVAIFSTTGGYQGIGFAIPINDADRIVKMIIEGKDVEPGWVGVSVQDLTPQLAAYFSLKNTDGVLIVSVLEGGPAEKAGLKDGDLILGIDGRPVRAMANLLKYIWHSAEGQKMTFQIRRGDKDMDISVAVGKRPQFEISKDEQMAADESAKPFSPKQPWRGIKVGEIPEDIQAQIDAKAARGVFVTEVHKRSPADQAGLRQGDIIISLNQRPVKGVDGFYGLAKNVHGRCLIQTLRGYLVLEDK